jgi:hypothetical protein
MSDQLMMKKLRDILLAEDREELERLRQTLEDPDQLSEKVGPIIEERMEFMRNNFPGEYRIVVDKLIEQKLEASKDELLEIIYPTLGQMIKKYVQHQIQLLKESIEEQLRNTFQRGIIGRIRYALFGFRADKMSEEIVSNLDGPTIEEIFVIEHHSGILLGSASRQNTIDLDMIAGMLTAIRSFVEDAFRRGEQQLESVRYETFTIMLENFHNYYIAAAVSGPMSEKERGQLSDELMKFAEKELKMNLKKKDGSSHHDIKTRLERRFFHSPQARLTAKATPS